jgi:deoxyribodipyrimidine photolyase
VPAIAIHRPWTVDPRLSPQRYPQPIVDHAAARQRALDAFAGLKRSTPRSA